MVDPINPLRRGEARRPAVDYHVRFQLEDGHGLMQLPVLQELGHDLERQTPCKKAAGPEGVGQSKAAGEFRLWVSRGVSFVRYTAGGREKNATMRIMRR